MRVTFITSSTSLPLWSCKTIRRSVAIRTFSSLLALQTTSTHACVFTPTITNVRLTMPDVSRTMLNVQRIMIKILRIEDIIRRKAAKIP